VTPIPAQPSQDSPPGTSCRSYPGSSATNCRLRSDDVNSRTSPTTPSNNGHPTTMNSIPRFARRAAAQATSASSWSCFFCQRTGTGAGAQWQPTSTATQAARTTTARAGLGSGGAKRFFSGTGKRRAQHQQPQQGQGQGQGQRRGAAAPGMDRMSEVYKRRNRSTAYYTISVILGTVAFSYGSVPMYKMV